MSLNVESSSQNQFAKTITSNFSAIICLEVHVKHSDELTT